MPKHFVNPSFEMVEAPVHLTNGNHLQGVQLHATCKMIVALLISCLALQTYPHECVPFSSSPLMVVWLLTFVSGLTERTSAA